MAAFWTIFGNLIALGKEGIPLIKEALAAYKRAQNEKEKLAILEACRAHDLDKLRGLIFG
jgi:hypothetical protein